MLNYKKNTLSIRAAFQTSEYDVYNQVLSHMLQDTIFQKFIIFYISLQGIPLIHHLHRKVSSWLYHVIKLYQMISILL